MAMKRRDCTQKEQNLRRKIDTEYSLFKYKMLSASTREIYEKCKQIYFYECHYEYFQYCEEVTDSIFSVSVGKDHVLQELWEVYLKYEYLGVENWKGIEELLNVYTVECEK